MKIITLALLTLVNTAMSEKERIDRLEIQLAELLIKSDSAEARLDQLTARVAQQDVILNRVLSLFGLTLSDLEAENKTETGSKPLLLAMRQSPN